MELAFSPAFLPDGTPIVQTELVKPFGLISGRTCPEVRLGFCVFSDKPGLPVIVLHPALTGSPRASTPGKSSQGDGWFSKMIGPGKLLDTSRFTIVCVDPLGGNGASSSAQELAPYLDSLEFADGIELVAAVLKNRGVHEIEAAIGGSIGGGQALQWIFQNRVRVKKVFDISGSACRSVSAVEFFEIQVDLLKASPQKWSELPQRLSSNMLDLKGQTEGFDLVFDHVLSEVKELITKYSVSKALQVARQVGFLRFVSPPFFQERLALYREELQSDEEARQKLLSWMAYQGDVFPSRFSASALAQLCAMDTRAKSRSPELIAEALLVRRTELIAFSVDGDALFPHKAQESFYHLVTECLPAEERWRMKFLSTTDRVNGHDHFLTAQFAESAEKLRVLLG